MKPFSDVAEIPAEINEYQKEKPKNKIKKKRTRDSCSFFLKKSTNFADW